MKHTKHELMLYSFYDFTGLASHLEAMAAKGWLAEKIGVLGIRYRRIQPQTLPWCPGEVTPRISGMTARRSCRNSATPLWT